MNKRSLIFTALVAGIPASAWAIGLEVKPYVGTVNYQEHAREVSVIDSKWNALLGGIRLELNELKQPWYAFIVEGSIWTSDRSEEEWEAFRYQQTNDLRVWGIEGKALLGVSVPIETVAFITPLAGFSYRSQKFTRSNFTINHIPRDLETVTDKYPILSVPLGINTEIIFQKQFGLFGRCLYHFIVDSKTDNSEVGEIKGDGGYILTAEAGAEWTDNKLFALGCGVLYELQDLKGGVDDTGRLEWPDNKLESISFLATFRFFF